MSTTSTMTMRGPSEPPARHARPAATSRLRLDMAWASSTDSQAGTAGAGRAGFAQALAFEWTKFRTGRPTLWTLVAAGVFLPAMAVFVAATTSIQPDDTILGGSLTGAVPVQMLAAVLGALVMTAEYTNGMIRTSFIASPRRVTVLGAKAVVAAVALFTVTLLAAVLAFVVGTLMLDGDTYARGEPWPALLGVALALTASGLLGLAVGTVVRHSAGAIAGVVAIILLPSLFGPLFGDLQRWVGGASPSGTLQKFTQTSDASPETVGALGPWPSLLILFLYATVALAASGWLLRSRDA